MQVNTHYKPYAIDLLKIIHHGDLKLLKTTISAIFEWMPPSIWLWTRGRTEPRESSESWVPLYKEFEVYILKYIETLNNFFTLKAEEH